jgi:hypothetical protein
MKWWKIVAVMVLLATPAMAAEERTIPIVGAPDLDVRLTPDLVVLPAASEAPASARLRVLERRRMGLTARNVIRVLRQMKEDGKLAQFVNASAADGVKEIDISNLSIAIAGELASENPGDWSDVDWDAIIDFIERLLALLIEYLPIIIDLFMGLF